MYHICNIATLYQINNIYIYIYNIYTYTYIYNTYIYLYIIYKSYVESISCTTKTNIYTSNIYEWRARFQVFNTLDRICGEIEHQVTSIQCREKSSIERDEQCLRMFVHRTEERKSNEIEFQRRSKEETTKGY